MIIFFGSGMYGKTDEVPGLFHVETRFGHVYWLPVIPLGSYIVLEKYGDEFSGASIGLSGKSVLMAWGRILCPVALVLSALAFYVALQTQTWMVPLAVMMLSGVGIWGCWVRTGCRRASYARAIALGEKVGLTPEGAALLELAYGNISEDDARAAIEQFRAEVAAQEAAQQQAAGQRGQQPPAYVAGVDE